MVTPKFIDISGLYPTLSKVIPGWIRGVYYCITAGQGVGKSKFARYSFVEWPYKYCKANGIPLRILYFAHEESESFFWTTIMLNLLREQFGVSMDYYTYHGYSPGFDEALHQPMIDSIMPIIEDMKQYIHVYDSVGNPTGILKTVEAELRTLGTFVKGEEFTDSSGKTGHYTTFVYDDPDTHVIVVNDHIGLLDTENNPNRPMNTLHLAMGGWSKYCVQEICKRYNCIAVNVHQQQMSGDGFEAVKTNRLEPSMNKLGDNLLIGRDYRVALGLFDPFKREYNINSYLKYTKTAQLEDNFRTIHVLKHTHGKNDYVVPMYFYGTTNQFEELPPVGSPNLINYLNSR